MMGNRKLHFVAAAIGIIILVFCLDYTEGNTSRRFVREAKEPKTTPKPKVCHRSTPCGWSAYRPFTKEIDSYMPNTCVCGEGLDCVRVENDISISAFVHYCRMKPETTEKTI